MIGTNFWVWGIYLIPIPKHHFWLCGIYPIIYPYPYHIPQIGYHTTYHKFSKNLIPIPIPIPHTTNWVSYHKTTIVVWVWVYTTYHIYNSVVNIILIYRIVIDGKLCCQICWKHRKNPKNRVRTSFIRMLFFSKNNLVY